MNGTYRGYDWKVEEPTLFITKNGKYFYNGVVWLHQLKEKNIEYFLDKYINMREQHIADYTPDSSHDMEKWHSEIRDYGNEPRFYSVRCCKKCGYEQSEHPAGEFIDPELKDICFE